MKNSILCLLISLYSYVSYSQVGSNNPNPDTTSILDLTSNKLGLLVPRMTTFERRAISNPANALLVYDTDDAMFYFHDQSYNGTGSSNWTGLTALRFRDDQSHFDIGSGLYKRDIYTHESTRYIGIATRYPVNTVTVFGNMSIGDSTTIAPVNGLFVKGKADFDNDLNVTKTVNADSVVATTLVGNGTTPVGGIIMWRGTTVPDDSWVICDGALISDAASPFNGQNSPNLSGRFIVGIGSNGTTNYNLNTTGGEDKHILTTNEMPAHNHGIIDPGHNHTVSDRYTAGGSDYAEANLGSDNKKNTTTTRTTSKTTTGISTNNNGGNASHENRPPFYALAYIMRIK